MRWSALGINIIHNESPAAYCLPVKRCVTIIQQNSAVVPQLWFEVHSQRKRQL